MNVLEIIQNCLLKYKDFHGRASRSEFLVFTIFYIFFVAVLSGAGHWIDPSLGAVLSILSLISLLLPEITLIVRRLHDVDKSGFLALLIVPIFTYGFKAGRPFPNKFGRPIITQKED